MGIKVEFMDDPALVLGQAREFLVSQPVLHNFIHTLLDAQVSWRSPAHYWVAKDGNKVVGIVVQSPLNFPVHITPMELTVVAAIVDAVAPSGIPLPGVNGDAATAACFAGQWTERSNSAARPVQANRLYEWTEKGEIPQVSGKLRRALSGDRSLMTAWTQAFDREVGELADEAELRVERGLAAGQFWLWDDREAMSMAVTRQPVAGVVRISGVYTPPEKRKRGYAAACVYALAQRLRQNGYRSILYTDLANAPSNSIYRRIGYRAVREVLRYRFGVNQSNTQ